MRGKSRLPVLPQFLAAGGNMSEDISLQVAAVQMSFPQVKIELLQTSGEHHLVKELFREIASNYARN